MVMAAGFAALIGVLPAARAAEFPTKPVTLVLGFAPGGPSDVMARILTKRMEELLKQPVVIENRAGAGGGIAANAVARAEPDGYTILLATGSSLAINVSLYKNLSYDPEKDFEPISLVGTQTNLLYTHPGSVPAKTLAEFVAYVKANPGKLNYGSPGIGTGGHLVTELLVKRTSMDAQHIPYQSTSQQVLAAAGGHLHFTFDTPGNARGLVESGKLRPLAVTGSRRTAFMPDVPTFEELGHHGFDLFVWNGLMAPAGTPPAIIEALNREALVCQQKPEVKTRMEQGSYEPGMLKPDAFAALIDNDLKIWTSVVRETGVQIKA
jgi:tripartite-type tricarboxylate transporter receptor subunit TctC